MAWWVARPAAMHRHPRFVTHVPVRCCAPELPGCRLLRMACRFPIVLLVALLGFPAQAQHQVTIYRCTDADGALTIQNDEPCPAGQKQEVREVDVPPPMPAYVPREQRIPDVVAAERAKQEAATLQAITPTVPVEERTAPPGLFQCTTWDKVEYLTDAEEPTERCAPMRVVGHDGRPQAGIGTACQKTVDQCTAIPEDELCDAWQRRVNEAEFRWKFARAAADDPMRIEYERLAAALANSTCSH